MNPLTKRRTREHIIADLSVNHAEKQFLLAGYTTNRVLDDYGYDLTIRTFEDGTGFLETGAIFVQLKASDAPDYSKDGDYVTVRVDERDDRFWRTESLPVALVFYDAGKDIAFYVHYQSVPQTNRRSVRIPTTSRFTPDVARQLRDLKNRARKDTRNADY